MKKKTNILFCVVIPLLLAFSCFEPKKENYTSLLREIIRRGVCDTSMQGNIECIELGKKRVYIIPYLDTLKSDAYLESFKARSKFNVLKETQGIIDTIRRSYGQPLDIDLKNLNINAVTNEKDAEIKVSFTRFFNIGPKKYCIIQIKEWPETWVLKALVEEGKLETEITVFSL